MGDESGAPLPRNAEQHPPAEQTSTSTSNLTVDESQRHSRKDSLSHAGGRKDGHWAAESARHLSPSPAPSGRLSPVPTGAYDPVDGQYDGQAKQSTLQRFWARNKGSVLVATSQAFGALMNMSARLLETEGNGMHPVQVLLLRQSITSLCCLVYMWWMKTPGAPFGGKDVRLLLFIRGTAGFFGIYGMWYSMMYLPLADATVITFLAPGIAGVLCYFLLKEPYTRMEILATLTALLGVVLIAQPASLFSQSSTSEDASAAEPHEEKNDLPGLDHESTAEERLMAVGVALLGVCGASGAFTTLRMIGKRAHALVSVNFFGVTCTVICIAILGLAPILDISQPSLSWQWPASAKGWFLLGILGALGFTMQYLLTAGLQADKSNRANSMVYTHMLFAVSIDRWVFHHEMNLMSFGGCALILGSAITVVLLKKPAPPKVEDVENQRSSMNQRNNLVGDGERSPMLVGVGGHSDDLPLSRL